MPDRNETFVQGIGLSSNGANVKTRAVAALTVFFVCLWAVSPKGEAASARGSFCAEAITLSEVEKLICESNKLKSLDWDLNARFESVMFFSMNNAKLRAGQRNWLVRERNKCRSAPCLEQAYLTRIGTLQQEIARLTVPSGVRVDRSNVEKVCQEIVALADRKVLENYSIPATLRADKTVSASESFALSLVKGKPMVRFSSVSTGGTCWSSELRNDSLEEAGKITFAQVDDPGDELRWSWWGAGDYPAYINGRFFAITSGDDPNHLRLISWIRPDGYIQPLCSVEQSFERVLSVKSTDPVCGTLELGGGQTPEWTEASEELAALEPPPYGTADRPSAVVASISPGANREKDEIAKFSIDSGAGCGAHVEWLRAVDTTRTSLVEGGLDKALSKLGMQNVIDLAVVTGHYYVTALDRPKKGAAYRIANGEAIKVCEYVGGTGSKVSRIW